MSDVVVSSSVMDCSDGSVKMWCSGCMSIGTICPVDLGNLV